jgi:bla regulator protein BlaR1
MIPKLFSQMWTAFAPAIGNHLWQSTLFAGVAGVLTLGLRKDHARVRYWLWLAASVKFLIPFSLLIGIGSSLAWIPGFAALRSAVIGSAALRSPAAPRPLYFAIEEISQPFTQSTTIAPAASATVFSSLIHLLPALLAGVWLCGFLVVLFVWCARWRRVSAAMRDAVPLREGRELEALRRLESAGEIREPIEMLVSPGSLEPGIFGIARPVLIWPAGISEHLGGAHLEAVLAHEILHVRHRDNLSAAIHMLVEAIFWFYPLVWWLGARLVEERERACDEDVLELGSDRQVYAESILKVCEFCVGSQLACVSGVTGADLKKRMVHIMTDRILLKLNFTRKVLLSAALFVSVALPVIFGLLNATQNRAEAQSADATASAPAYNVTSIKVDKSEGKKTFFKVSVSPDGLTIAGTTLRSLIEEAYGVQPDQISSTPGLLGSERYDIDAKTDKSVADELQSLDQDQRLAANQRMLQQLLANKFKLMVHSEAKVLPQYALTIAEGGSKLQKATPGDTYANGVKDPLGHTGGNLMFAMGKGGSVTGQGVPIANLVGLLSRQLGRTVVDKTGLTGNYDFTLQWTADESPRTPDGTPLPTTLSSILTAVQEQLGLKLETQTGPVQILVIDHVEVPSAELSQ